MEKIKANAVFCKIYSDYHGETIDNKKQIKQTCLTGDELHEFCDFYSRNLYAHKNSQLNGELEKNKTRITISVAFLIAFTLIGIAIAIVG